MKGRLKQARKHVDNAKGELVLAAMSFLGEGSEKAKLFERMVIELSQVVGDLTITSMMIKETIDEIDKPESRDFGECWACEAKIIEEGQSVCNVCQHLLVDPWEGK